MYTGGIWKILFPSYLFTCHHSGIVECQVEAKYALYNSIVNEIQGRFR